MKDLGINIVYLTQTESLTVHMKLSMTGRVLNAERIKQIIEDMKQGLQLLGCCEGADSHPFIMSLDMGIW